VKSWIDDGLRPRAVTRDLEWGIPVPVDGGEGKVLYVWFDAPIGYISSTKEWAEREGKNWEDYWKDENTKLVHFIGKDNIVFHCIIFPSMLKAHGGYILPENVPANEFLNLEGNKLSTSKNWAVWLHEYLEDFPNQQDVLRYTLTANAPENKDNDFTWKDFQAKNNNELVAIFGNFINRVVVLTNKYYDGQVPVAGEFTEVDEDTLAAIKHFPESIGKSIQRYRFREASQELMNLARLGNKYLADEEPWKVIKVDEKRVKTIMYVALQISAALALVSEPFLPFTSDKLKKMLHISNENDRSWNDVSEKEVLLPANHQIGSAELLFSKIEDKTVTTQLEKLAATKKANEQENKVIEPQKETIDFEDFTKLDMRVGTILEAVKVAKTKKLLQLKVDVGIDVRTIVSGIAESFSPEDIIGQQVTVLTNLAPRKIRGVESQGMILMTDTPDGKLAFVEPEQKVSNGQQIS
jgi:methionyl-tRNA synthetase